MILALVGLVLPWEKFSLVMKNGVSCYWNLFSLSREVILGCNKAYLIEISLIHLHIGHIHHIQDFSLYNIFRQSKQSEAYFPDMKMLGI